MLKIQRDVLLHSLIAVKPATRAIGDGATTNCIYFYVIDGQLLISATDMKTEIKAYHDPIEGKVEFSNDLRMVLPSKKLVELVKQCPRDGVIKFQQSSTAKNSYAMKCTGVRSRYTLRNDDMSTFPISNMCEKNISIFKCNALSFQRGMKSVESAMGQRDTRKFLNGVSIASEKDQCVFTTGDGHRLMQNKVAIDHESGDKIFGCILHREDQKVLMGLLKDYDEELLIKIDSNHMLVRMGSVEFKSTLIDAVYPNVASLIPRKNSKKIKLVRADMLAALKLLKLMTDDKNLGVILTLSADGLKLTSGREDTNTGEEIITPISQSRFEIEIRLNAGYLYDTLNASCAPEITLMLEGPENPVLVKDELEKTLLGVVMPMVA